MSLMSWLGDLVGAGGSWLGFGILILILIWLLVFATPPFRILALYFDFECAKDIHVLIVPILGFGGGWRFLTWVWHLYLHLDMVTGLCYTYIPIFRILALCLDFEGEKTSMSLMSWFGAFVEAGGSWLGFGVLILMWIGSLVFATSIFWILALSRFWRCKEHPCP